MSATRYARGFPRNSLSSIGKYFERGGDADVVVGKEGHAFQVDCAVTLASGQKLVSSGLGGDATAPSARP